VGGEKQSHTVQGFKMNSDKSYRVRSQSDENEGEEQGIEGPAECLQPGKSVAQLRREKKRALLGMSGRK
jgi:hypothetical protein